MHFTRMGGYEDAEIPVIVSGEGCYVFDQHGKRYLDGLSALYCVNAGHGREELAQAAAAQAAELAFYTNWSYAHPASIELAALIAGLAPPGLQRVFFTSGGSEAGRVSLEARARLPPRPRRAGSLQDHRARDRLPRHVDGRARATVSRACACPTSR